MKTYINGWPITAQFGSIDPTHQIPHKGIDFGIPLGTPVPSIKEGVVTAITNEGNQSFGLAVHVQMKDGTQAIYGHLSRVNVTAGQRIRAGDLIGLSGDTGDSTGPHLHLQLMQHGVPINPVTYLQPHKNLGVMDQIRVLHDANENGWVHALTGQTPQEWLSVGIGAIGQVALLGVLISLPLACFGNKFGRKWVIRFIAAYLCLVVAKYAVIS